MPRRLPVETQIKALPKPLQTRMAVYALEGWKFEYNLATNGWFGHPPEVRQECLWDVSLEDLMVRMGDPDEELW